MDDRELLSGKTLAHPFGMRPGFFRAPRPRRKAFPMFDEILDFFDRRRRGPEARRPQPSRGTLGDLFAGDDDDGDDGRRPSDEDRRGDSRRDRYDRRDPVTDWD